MLNVLKSTVKSTAIYGIGNLSSRLIGFVLIPIYTSHLSISEYGIMGMLEISAQIIIALLGMGLYNAFFRWYWDEQYNGQQKSILFTIIITILSLSIVFFIPIILYRKSLAIILLDSPQYSHLIILLYISSSIEVLNILIVTLIRIKDKPVLFTILMLTKLIISLSLNIYFVVFENKSVAGVYYAQIIGASSFLILSSGFVLREVKFSLKTKILKEMLKYSSPLLIVALSGIVLNITDRYVLKFYTNMGEVGKYSLGFKLSNTIRVFIITSVNMALQPTIYKMIYEPNNKRFYSKVMTYYSFILMPFVLGISIFGKEIIELLSKNPDFNSGYKVIPIISLGLFFTMLRDTALTGINISKKTHLTARIIIVSMIFNIFLSLLLVKQFGYIGAAVSVTVSQFIFFVLVYYYSQKVFYIPYELKKIVLIIIVGFFLYGVTLFIPEVEITLRIIIKVIVILFFPFLLLLLGFYDPIEKKRIIGFWNKWKNINQIRKNINILKEKEKEKK